MKKISIGLLDELAKNQQRISELEMKGLWNVEFYVWFLWI